jgi:uncharacterized protein YecA (UPF0149 family)
MADDTDTLQEIYHRQIDTTVENANYGLLSELADIESCDETELPPMYDRIDHLLDELFSTPPAPEAQVELTFSYHGYRITIDQGGSLTLRRLGEEPPEQR